MTTAGSVLFPDDPAGLAGLPVAHLSQLTKSIPAPAGFEPGSWKSVAHLLPKADKVMLLEHAHYGIPHNISHLPAKGQALYAANQAKQAANKAGKVKTGTNCAATLGKTLIESAVAPFNPYKAKLADVGSFFAQHAVSPEDMDLGVLTQLRNATKALLEAGPEMDGPEVDALHEVWLMMKALGSHTENAKQGAFATWTVNTTEQTVIVGLKNIVDTLAGEAYEEAKGVQQFAEVLLGKVKSQQGVASKTALNAMEIVQQGNVYAFDGIPALMPEKLVEAFGQLAAETPTTLAKKMLPKDIESVLANAEVIAEDVLTDPSMAAKLASLTDEELVNFTDSLQKTAGLAKAVQEAPKEEPWAFAIGAIEKAQDTKALDSLLAGESALDAAVETAKETLSKLSAAELKKLGGEVAEEAGVTPSLAKSYMDKDTLTSFIAKAQAADHPVSADLSEEVAKAEAKYAAHQAAQKAKKAGTKGPQAVPDAQAAPGTAQTTAKALDDAAHDAKAALSPTLDDLDGQEHFTPSPEVLSPVTELGNHKPAQVSHTWSPNPNEKALPGAHSKQTFLDEQGDVWMWKKAFEGTDDVEAAAHEVGWLLGFDMADIRVVENFPTRYGARESKFGTIQKFHKGVKGDLKGVPMSTLTPEQITQVQEHQVLDWLLAQHDTHAENLMVHADGHLIPIDKGQAWKFLGNDKLATDYNPVSKTVYSSLWDDVLRGRVAVDFDAIDSMLAKVEALDDDELRHLLLPVFKKRYERNQASLHFLGGKAAQGPEEMFQVFLERKHNIRADFTAFYEDIAQRSGTTWAPKWAQAVEEAAQEGLSTAQAATAVNGIATPVDAALASAVDASASAGKALHLAGEEISGGQALLWRETGLAGDKVLRLELRLEDQADQRLTQLFADASGQAATSSAPMVAKKVPDTYHGDVLGGAKTVNHHVPDGEYNKTKIANMQAAKAKAQAVVDDAELVDYDAALKNGLYDSEKFATEMAKVDQAKHYLELIADVEKAMVGTTKTTKLVEAFDGDAAYAKHLAEAEKKLGEAKPKAVTVAPDPIFVGKPTRGTNTIADMTTDPGEYMGYRRTGSRINMSGEQYTATMDVDGVKLTVRYTGGTMTEQITRKSLLDIEVEGWDGSEEVIAKVLRAVQRLGVDTRMATAEDEALTYWRVSTRAMKFSKEYHHSTGAGAYAKVRPTIDRIEQRVAATPGLTPADEIAIYKDEWASVFGQEAIDKAVERTVHVHDLLGREVGYGHMQRFDLPDDLAYAYNKQGKQFGLATGIQGHNLDPTIFVDNPGAVSAQELARLGQYGKRATTSQASDMRTGGGHGVFTSQGFSSWQSGREVLVMNPSTVTRRVSTHAYDRDSYGELAERVRFNNLNPDTWNDQYLSPRMTYNKNSGSNNETIVRHNVSFADDMELLFVRSKSKRDDILRSLKDQGVTEIRGLPVEDRIVYAVTDDEIITLTNQHFGNNMHVYQRSYTADPAPGTTTALTGTRSAPPPPPAAVPVGSAKSAHLGLVIQDIQSGAVKNSVAAKAKAASLALKKSPDTVKADFEAYATKHLKYVGDSQTKKFDIYLAYEKKKAGIQDAVAQLATAEEKVTWIVTNSPYGVAKSDVIGEVLGQTYQELADEASSLALKGSELNDFFVKKAKALDALNTPAAQPYSGTVTIQVYGGQVPKELNPQQAIDALTTVGDLADTEAKKLVAQVLGTDPDDWELVKSVIAGLKDDFGQSADIDYIAKGLIQKLKKEAKSLGIDILPPGSAAAPPGSAANVPAALQVVGVKKVPEGAELEALKDTLEGVAGTEKLDVLTSAFGMEGDSISQADNLWIALHPGQQPGSTNAMTKDILGWLDANAAPAPQTVAANLPGAAEALAKAESAVAKAQSTDYFGALDDMLDSLGIPAPAKNGDKLVEVQKAYSELAVQGLVPPSGINTGIADFAQGIADYQKLKASVVTHTVTPGLSPTKLAKIAELGDPDFIIAKVGDMELKQGTYNDFYDAVQEYNAGNFGVSDVKKVLGVTDLPTGMLDVWKDEAANFGGNLFEWLLSKADEGLAQAAKSAPPSAAANATGVLNAAAKLAPEDIGKLAAEVPGEKVFNYAAPGGKVAVQFVKDGAGATNIIAQGAAQGPGADVWYVIAHGITGKTTKEQIVEYLKAINHAYAEPF